MAGGEPGGLRAAAAGGAAPPAESRHGCDMGLRGGLCSAGTRGLAGRSPLGARCGVLCLVLPGAGFPEVTRITQAVTNISFFKAKHDCFTAIIVLNCIL